MAVETDFNMKTVLHDIANLITPFSNFPERIGDVTKTMEVTLRHLRQAENEIERNMEDIGEFLKKDKRGRKILPPLQEICNMEQENLERFRRESDMPFLQIKNIKTLILKCRGILKYGERKKVCIKAGGIG